MTITADWQRPSMLWWLYFYCLAGFAVLGAVPYVLVLLRSEQEHKMLIGAAAWVLNACDLVGLWCYIRSRPLGVAWLWRVFLALTVAQLAFAAYQFEKAFMMVLPFESFFPVRGERIVSLVGLCSVLFAVPLLIALWRYAFRSPELWQP
jgi:hypothetical protein